MRRNREPEAASLVVRSCFVLAVLTLLMMGAAGGALAQEEQPEEGADRLIADGRLVYEANCVACHQADGLGTPGVFPPLVDNPRIDDSEYLRTVVMNGLEGEIEVNGEVYNGAMPAFAALDDAQKDALIAYLQNALGQAAVPGDAPPTTLGGTAGTSLPVGTVIFSQLAFLIALGIAVVVLIPVLLVRKLNRRKFTDGQVWLKSLSIVAYFAVATVIIPSLVIQSSFLAAPPDAYLDLISPDQWGIFRDIIGSTLWLAALGFGMWLLRRLQKEHVI